MAEHKKATRQRRKRTPIQVKGRFATAWDTARVLGVPKSRAEFLINLAKQSLSAATIKKAKNGTQTELNVNRPKTKAAPVVLAAKKKPGSTHAQSTVKKAKAARSN